MAEVDCWCINAWNIQKREMATTLGSKTENTCGSGISSIFDTVLRYLPIFLTVLRYLPIFLTVLRYLPIFLTVLRYWVPTP
mgnify:CR=1 FL=1